MAALTIPNSFVAGTPAQAGLVNGNFNAIVTWSTQLDQTNFAAFTGPLTFNLSANTQAIIINNDGSQESIKITQTDTLATDKATIFINDQQTQIAAGAAEFKMSLASGATIPAIHINHGGVDTFKLTSRSLLLPVSTTAQRDAISSPVTGTILYNSTTQQLNERKSNTWTPVGAPVGSVIMYAGSTAPAGWLLCIGSAVPNGSGTIQSITTDFSALYAVVGATLPDLQGRVPVGAGTGAGLTARTLAATGGQENMENHQHAAGNIVARIDRIAGPTDTSIRAHFVPATTWTSNQGYQFMGANGLFESRDEGVSTQGESASVTQSVTDKNMQPYLVLNYIIKY